MDLLLIGRQSRAQNTREHLNMLVRTHEELILSRVPLNLDTICVGCEVHHAAQRDVGCPGRAVENQSLARNV